MTPGQQTTPDQRTNPNLPPSVQTTPEATTPQTGQETPAGQSSANATATTIEGCLSGSNGNFMLNAQDGTTYQLSGDTAKLADHVGHDIQVTGTVTPSNTTSTSGTGSQTGAAGSASANSQQPTIDVTSFKHISSSCKTSK